VGLSDPVRPTVAAAIQECHTAGIRVVMITGDYPETAQTIARQIGLMPMGAIITGAELDLMSEAELQQRVQSTNIFARAVPEQKLRLVNALKDQGEVVAMTGDGVNDAPALKSAQIGIARGQRGTDVARESAALVLLDDDFSSIVQAVKLGRRIFDNLRKAMSYLLAIHIPIAGMSFLILANLGLILSESSTSRLSLKILQSPNAALWWVICGGLFFLAIVLYVPFLRHLFSFSFLHPLDLVICLGGGAIGLLWFELLKLLNPPR
jgi:Ca2+-transporting ATPase